MLVRATTTPLRTGPRVQRASGIPCALSFRGRKKSKLGRIAPRECERVSTVIASAAKQSIAPHKGRMDCFAPLAMTVLDVGRPRCYGEKRRRGCGHPRAPCSRNGEPHVAIV